MRHIIVTWFMPSLFASPTGNPYYPLEYVFNTLSVPPATAYEQGAALSSSSNHPFIQAGFHRNPPSVINQEHLVSNTQYAQQFGHQIQHHPSYISGEVPSTPIDTSRYFPIQLQMMLLPQSPNIPFLPHQTVTPSEASGSRTLPGGMQLHPGSLPPIMEDFTAARSIRFDHPAGNGLVYSENIDLMRPKPVRDNPSPPTQGAFKRLRESESFNTKINADTIGKKQAGSMGQDVLEGSRLIYPRPVIDVRLHEHLAAPFIDECEKIVSQTSGLVTGRAARYADHHDLANLPFRYTTIQGSPHAEKNDKSFTRITNGLTTGIKKGALFLSAKETSDRLHRLLLLIWHYHDRWLDYIKMESKPQTEEDLYDWLWEAFFHPKGGLFPVVGFTQKTSNVDEDRVGPTQRLFIEYLGLPNRQKREDTTAIGVIANFLVSRTTPASDPELEYKYRLDLVEAITSAQSDQKIS